MSVGAFSQLMAEAKNLGVTELEFSVDLETFDGGHAKWFCIAGFGNYIRPRLCGQGRTGEETLRMVVDRIKQDRRPSRPDADR